LTGTKEKEKPFHAITFHHSAKSTEKLAISIITDFPAIVTKQSEIIHIFPCNTDKIS
jgi:hypothetical protein